MRKPLGLCIVLLTVIWSCEAFHLQGHRSVRQSVCATALPCCPGHVCRSYQRFDASRPVAACATSIQARPMYAPGSPAQRRFCGSTTRDIFSRRTGSLRSRNPGFARDVFDQNTLNSGARRIRFPNQFIGSQQWRRSGPRLRQPDQGLSLSDRQGQLSQFSDRSRFDPFTSSFGSQTSPGRFQVQRPGLRSRGFPSQLNTLAAVPQEQRPFVQSQLGLPQSRTSFPGGQRGSLFPPSQSDTSLTQGQGIISFPQGQGLSFPQRHASFSQRQGQTSIPQGQGHFGERSQDRSQSFRGRDTFGQDLSFSQQSSFGGRDFTDSQSILNQLNQFPSDLTQDPALTSGGQSLNPLPSSGRSLTDPSLAFRDLLPQDRLPQPMLMEQPGISVSPILGAIPKSGSEPNPISDTVPTTSSQTAVQKTGSKTGVKSEASIVSQQTPVIDNNNNDINNKNKAQV